MKLMKYVIILELVNKIVFTLFLWSDLNMGLLYRLPVCIYHWGESPILQEGCIIKILEMRRMLFPF